MEFSIFAERWSRPADEARVAAPGTSAQQSTWAAAMQWPVLQVAKWVLSSRLLYMHVITSLVYPGLDFVQWYPMYGSINTSTTKGSEVLMK